MDRREYEYDFDSRRDHGRSRRDDRRVFRERDTYSEGGRRSPYHDNERRDDEERFESRRPYNIEDDHTQRFSHFDSTKEFRPMAFPALQSFTPQLYNSSEIPFNPAMPLVAYQLQLMELMKSMNPVAAIVRPSCSLYPPKSPIPNSQRPKPIGCKTIFVTGLPDVVDDDMITEIFFPCGAIESINIRKASTDFPKNFCHIRFVDRASVDQAVLFNGFEIIAERGDRERRTLKVEYALGKNTKRDQEEFEREEREHYRLLDDQKKAEEAENGPPSKRRLTEYETSCVLEDLKDNTKFMDSVKVVNAWIERGDMNRKNANYVFKLVSSLNSHVKRLAKDKREHDQLIELQKFEQVKRSKEIKDQFTAINSVFEKVGMKKAWDNFTKAQRRSISQWKQQAKSLFKELGVNSDMSIEDRVEVGMELDDDDAIQSTASSSEYTAQSQECYTEGNISQSDSASTQSGYVDTSVGQITPDAAQSQDVDYFQHLKKPKVDSETEKTINDLKYENSKLQAQVSCLKALVEQNTNLAMRLQEYKKDAELAKQEFNTAVQSREERISQLNTALYGLKLYLYNSGLPQQIVDGVQPDWSVTVYNQETEPVYNQEAEPVTSPNTDSCNTTEEGETSGIDEKTEGSVPLVHSSSEVNTQQSTSVDLTGREVAQVALICTYLSICPQGASEDDIVRHLDLLSCKVTKEQVKKLLESLPTLFTCSPQDETQQSEICYWSFCGQSSAKFLSEKT